MTAYEVRLYDSSTEYVEAEYVQITKHSVQFYNERTVYAVLVAYYPSITIRSIRKEKTACTENLQGTCYNANL